MTRFRLAAFVVVFVVAASVAAQTTNGSGEPPLDAGVGSNDTAGKGQRRAGNDRPSETAHPKQETPANRSDKLVLAILVLSVFGFGASVFLLIQIRKLGRGMAETMRSRDTEVRETLSTLRSEVAAVPYNLAAKLQKLDERMETVVSDLNTGRKEIIARINALRNDPALGQDSQSKNAASQRNVEVDRWDDDDSIADTLQLLAKDCLRSPMTQAQASARLSGRWTVDGYGENDGDLPDAFVIRAGSGGDWWFVPNNRSWRKLPRGLFEGIGPDLPHAQIVRIEILPRVRRTSFGLELRSGRPGKVEISIA